MAGRPATSSYGTAARTSGSDQPSGSGLPGSWAVPTTISRPRHTVLHNAITTATPVSSRVAARGCSRCSASRAIGHAVSGRTSGRKTNTPMSPQTSRFGPRLPEQFTQQALVVRLQAR